jgi:methyl-accepting chemotaxis protein
MDLDTAIAAHAEWKIKLRSAMTTGERLDVASISADNCCELGRWLHGPGSAPLRSNPLHAECIGKHAAFHREAGKVAQAINARQYDQAESMLASGSAYVGASSAVGLCLSRMKRALAPT